LGNRTRSASCKMGLALAGYESIQQKTLTGVL
jgi:hypothetical protein